MINLVILIQPIQKNPWIVLSVYFETIYDYLIQNSNHDSTCAIWIYNDFLRETVDDKKCGLGSTSFWFRLSSS